MSDEKNQVIPFGKHKGKTIEEVQTFDPNYLHWLTAQDWFRDKFVVLHQTIIQGTEPEETPEHNALQTMFLNDAFCWKVADVVGFKGNFDFDREPEIKREFEWRGIDVLFSIWLKKYSHRVQEFMVEIKPTVGDDYPAILRQISAASVRCNEPHRLIKILLLERYTGTGATREQFIEIFKNSGIAVVFLEQVK